MYLYGHRELTMSKMCKETKEKEARFQKMKL